MSGWRTWNDCMLGMRREEEQERLEQETSEREMNEKNKKLIKTIKKMIAKTLHTALNRWSFQNNENKMLERKRKKIILRIMHHSLSLSYQTWHFVVQETKRLRALKKKEEKKLFLYL